MTLGEELFAIDIFSVREILDFTDITRIPQTPEFMKGNCAAMTCPICWRP